MTREEIFKIVAKETAEALEEDISRVKIESSLVRDLDAESIDLIDLSFRLERVFKITIEEGELFDRKPSDDYIRVETVGQIVDFIARKLS